MAIFTHRLSVSFAIITFGWWRYNRLYKVLRDGTIVMDIQVIRHRVTAIFTVGRARNIYNHLNVFYNILSTFYYRIALKFILKGCTHMLQRLDLKSS